VIWADDHLLALGDAGQLAVVECVPDEYREKARWDILDGKCWSTPAVAGGRLYARSTKEGACFDLSTRVAAR
jgi:outer membrane protein assembly factor BamB